MPYPICRQRRHWPNGEAVCSEDGWPCADHGPGLRAPGACPRFRPVRFPCPSCAASGAPGDAPAMLLADASGLTPRAHFACPACGYRTDAMGYARDMLRRHKAPHDAPALPAAPAPTNESPLPAGATTSACNLPVHK